jgi:hypothetical protein
MLAASRRSHGSGPPPTVRSPDEPPARTLRIRSLPHKRNSVFPARARRGGNQARSIRTGSEPLRLARPSIPSLPDARTLCVRPGPLEIRAILRHNPLFLGHIRITRVVKSEHPCPLSQRQYNENPDAARAFRQRRRTFSAMRHHGETRIRRDPRPAGHRLPQ